MVVTLRWIEVVLRLLTTVQDLNHDMAALRNNLVADVNNAMHSIGDVPSENLHEVLKLLRRYFTNHDSPSRNTQSNRQFQRRLDELIDQDRVYKVDPSIGRYLYHLSMLIAEWERDHQKEILRTNGPSTQVVTTIRQGGKQVHYDTDGSRARATTSITIDGSIVCEGCGRKGHLRSNCVLKDHVDFNREEPWKGSKSCKALQNYLSKITVDP